MGWHTELDYLLLQVSAAAFRTAFATLLRIAVERSISGVHTVLCISGVFSIVVLAVADCLFGHYWSKHADELLITARP